MLYESAFSPMRRMPILALLSVVATPAVSGDIAGMAPPLPPFVEQRLEFSFSNDFLGRGGSIDDYRTQQITIAADIGERWSTIFDHSLLTLKDPANAARIDQLSASLGYRVLRHNGPDGAVSVTAGFGVRGTGDFAGERMQNGFHRLVGSEIEYLPYADADETLATAWFDAGRYASLHDAGSWSLGYWLWGRALATSGGQFDAGAGAMAVARRAGFAAWTGLRHDWRTGYTEPVQRATADQEQDLAFVIGMRFGSLVVETVQQFDNDASFGQLRLLSSENASKGRAFGNSRYAVEAGLLLPDVHMHFAGRFSASILLPPSSSWHESVYVSVDSGEPQLGDPSIYAKSFQLGAGIDWERSLSAKSDWMGAYVAFGGGWRRERLIGAGSLAGEESGWLDRAVLLGGTGLRFNATTFGERLRYRIQLGLSTWLPLRSGRLTIGDYTLDVQEPNAALSLGVTFEFA